MISLNASSSFTRTNEQACCKFLVNLLMCFDIFRAERWNESTKTRARIFIIDSIHRVLKEGEGREKKKKKRKCQQTNSRYKRVYIFPSQSGMFCCTCRYVDLLNWKENWSPIFVKPLLAWYMHLFAIYSTKEVMTHRRQEKASWLQFSSGQAIITSKKFIALEFGASWVIFFFISPLFLVWSLLRDPSPAIQLIKTRWSFVIFYTGIISLDILKIPRIEGVYL